MSERTRREQADEAIERALIARRRGDLRGALAQIRRAAELDPRASTYHALIAIAEKLSRTGVAAEARRAAVAITPGDSVRRARVASWHLGRGDAELALSLAAEDDVGTRLAAALEADVDALTEHARAVGEAAPIAIRRDAAIALFSRGAFDEAEARWARLADAGDVASRAWRVRARLFAGHAADAEVLAIDEAHVDGCALRATLALTRGAYREALVHADRALAIDDAHGESLALRGAALSALRQKTEAFAPLEQALRATRSRSLGTRVEMALLDPGAKHVDVPPLLATAREVGVCDAGLAAKARPGDARSVEAALLGLRARLHGNYTAAPTCVDAAGRLVALRSDGGPRAAARRAQGRIATRPSEAMAGLDEVLARHGESPTVLCHHGELALWLGDFESALADLDRALELEPATRWAWIGKTTALVLLGRADDAWSTSMGADGWMPTGRAMWVARAEAALRTGRLVDAASAIETAVQLDPPRISARILRALIRHASGNDRGAPARTLEALARALPVLVDDARREAPEAADARALLEAVLAISRGNRSASMLTWIAEGDVAVASAPVLPEGA